MTYQKTMIRALALFLFGAACGDSGSPTTATGPEVVIDRQLPDLVVDQLALASSGLISTPSGYHQISIIEDARPIASFVVSVPESFRGFWKVGQDPEEWLKRVIERDPEFGELIAGDLRNSGPLDNRRLVTIDAAAPSAALAIVQVQLSAPDTLQTPDELIAAYIASATESGATGIFGEKLPWRGLEVAYVGARIGTDLTVVSGNRYEMITYYFDTTNHVQWSVGCDVPAELFSTYEPQCQRIGQSFVPFSMWNDLDLAQGPDGE